MAAEAPTQGLLDTNVIVHWDSVDRAALPDVVAISAVTLAELSAGPLATSDPLEQAARQRRLQRVEATFDPLPFDAEAARHYGPVFAAVRAAGRTPRRRMTDLMIACTAVAHGLPLFTMNAQDFAGLERVVDVVAVQRPRQST